MIQEIYDRLTTDQAFAEELKKFVENRKLESVADEGAVFVEFANSQGYDVTLDDVERFVETKYKALSEEELEKINAAGAGGYCALIGLGWNNAYGIGITKCSIIGIGLGLTWKDATDPANKDEAEMAKKIVETIGKVGGKVNGVSF